MGGGKKIRTSTADNDDAVRRHGVRNVRTVRQPQGKKSSFVTDCSVLSFVHSFFPPFFFFLLGQICAHNNEHLPGPLQRSHQLLQKAFGHWSFCCIWIWSVASSSLPTKKKTFFSHVSSLRHSCFGLWCPPSNRSNLYQHHILQQGCALGVQVQLWQHFDACSDDCLSHLHALHEEARSHQVQRL